MLVVIDMQSNFDASKNKVTQRNICREIISARKKNEPVVVMEFSGCDPTLPIIKKRAQTAKAVFLKKNRDDGSAEIVSWAKRMNVPLWKIRVCGVNTAACVAATVRGLSSKLPSSEIVVVADACNGSEGKREGFSNFPSGKNVRVVRKV